MEENKANGSGFLKVTGILMIIGGALSLIIGIIAVLGVSAIAYISSGQVDTGMLYAASILTVVSAAAQLTAGIIGVKNCNNPEKSGTCMVWGVIVALLAVAGAILTTVAGNSFPVLSLLLGLVLPILFIIGALKNKNA